MSENQTNTQPPKTKSPYKCPMHNTWMRKGHCEQCALAKDRREAAKLLEDGVIKPKIKIGKL